MKVGKVELLERHDKEAVEWMTVMRAGFNAIALDQFLRDCGYSIPVAYRIADKLIQREQKAANIRQIKRGVWVWCGVDDA